MGPGVRRDDGRDSKHLKIFAMLPVRHFGLKPLDLDRKSTRLNSSHGYISYAVFCLKKKNRDEHYQSPMTLTERQAPQRRKLKFTPGISKTLCYNTPIVLLLLQHLAISVAFTHIITS